MKIKINKSKLLKRSILTLLLLACVGVFVAHKIVQRYGFEGIGEFISIYRHNKNLADLVEPKEIKILLANEDYEFIKNRRDIALERGIQINDTDDGYVDCKIVEGEDTIKGELRLKGHMTDHLEGEKWSFRIKTKKKPVLGMTRFSLQAPGTRNYAYEWVYHELLKNEDIIHLYYDFIHLELNEKDLGIYAVEEHFGQHVLDHNNRPNGAILRWNPNLYWEGRIDELQGTYLDEDYSHYSSSFVEPYESGTVEDDSLLVLTYQKGAAMLESFRRGEKVTSEIFDVNKLAKFHAIIDLVGGHHSLDWSDVKFFYNSESEKIEPVGYESFSVRPTESIAGQRIPSEYDELEFDYHNMLFSDPVFFAAYIQELERICDEKYLNDFMKKIQKELDEKLGILAHEFPYRKFSFDGYFNNIELIRHNLELPKAFHAFRENATDSTIAISLTPVSDFPIEILSLVVDGKDEFRLDSAFILPAKARNTYAHYFNILIHHDSKKLKKLKLKARIPGSKRIFEIEVSDLPGYQLHQPTNLALGCDSGLHQIGMGKINDSVFYFKNKETIINDFVFVNSHEKLIFFPGQKLIFEEWGQLIIDGRLELIGGSDDGEEIVVKSAMIEYADSLDDRIFEHIVIENGELLCKNVVFSGSDNLIHASNSSLQFMFCTFSDIETNFIRSYESEITLNRCASGSMNSLGRFDRSIVRINDFTAKKGDVFIKGFGTDFDIANSDISRYTVIADLNQVSDFTAWSSAFSATESIAILNNASEFKTYGGTISDAPVAFKIGFETYLPGESLYVLYKTTSNNISKVEEKKSI